MEFLINNAGFLVSQMDQIEMSIDAPWFIADVFDGILKIHEQCRGHYRSGDKQTNMNKDREAEELNKENEWIRKLRDEFKRKERRLSDRFISGDETALDEMLDTSFKKHTSKPSQEDLIRKAIEEMDDEDL